MRTLTDGEVESWLADRGIQRAPYESSNLVFDGFYQQVNIPKAALQRWAFASCIVGACGTSKEALLHFTDWSLYTPDQMAIISAVLAAHGESRHLIEAPAQAFAAGEAELLAGMLGLAMTFEWNAYLYIENGPTFLAWEGNILDMWVPLNQERVIRKRIDDFFGTKE